MCILVRLFDLGPLNSSSLAYMNLWLRQETGALQLVSPVSKASLLWLDLAQTLQHQGNAPLVAEVAL